jgi:hypothetical protein
MRHIHRYHPLTPCTTARSAGTISSKNRRKCKASQHQACPDMSTAAQDVSGFFTIPRELRDEIYHQAFTTNCCLYHSYIPDDDYPYSKEASYNLALRYNYGVTSTTQNTINDGAPVVKPTWLLTFKTFFHEGATQYLRHAKWVWLANHTDEPIAGRRLWSAQLSTLSITRLELKVSNLANYETPHRFQGTDSRRDVARIADCMRTTNACLSTVRFVGHSYLLEEGPDEPTWFGTVENMMSNLKEAFSGVRVNKFELGIVGRPIDWMWVLYEWVEGSTSAGLQLMADNRMDPLLRAEHIDEVERERVSREAWNKARVLRRNLKRASVRSTGGGGEQAEQQGSDNSAHT